jgi:hypothetical protein
MQSCCAAIEVMPLQLRSPAFAPGGRLPAANTCDGSAGNPALVFTGVPAGTKSLAVLVEDPDVPWILQHNHLFVHWMTWDLPPTAAGIAEGQASGGMSDGGAGYVAPCPPFGTHRYVFRLFALDAQLGPDAHIATRDDFYKAVNAHTLERAELVSVYSRPFGTQAAPFGVLAVLCVMIGGGAYAVYRGIRGLLRGGR